MPVLFYLTGYYVLSNYSPHAVMLDGKLYPTAEHAYQAAKFTDPEIIEAIRLTTSPLQAKNYAHAQSADMSEGWSDRRIQTMEAILRAKLDQHSEVKDALIKSGDQEIIEDSPVDSFWGRGADGGGQNQLGKLWMMLRGEIITSR